MTALSRGGPPGRRRWPGSPPQADVGGRGHRPSPSRPWRTSGPSSGSDGGPQQWPQWGQHQQRRASADRWPQRGHAASSPRVPAPAGALRPGRRNDSAAISPNALDLEVIALLPRRGAAPAVSVLRPPRSTSCRVRSPGRPHAPDHTDTSPAAKAGGSTPDRHRGAGRCQGAPVGAGRRSLPSSPRAHCEPPSERLGPATGADPHRRGGCRSPRRGPGAGGRRRSYPQDPAQFFRFFRFFRTPGDRIPG